MMNAPIRKRRTYDHRLRDLVRANGDIRPATQRGIPRSTARGWLAPTSTPVVTVAALDQDLVRLQSEVLVLQQRLQRLITLLRLVVVLWKVSASSLNLARILDQDGKLKLVQAIEQSQSVLPLRVVLRFLHVSSSRYHAWKSQPACSADEFFYCPRSAPQQLTPQECDTIKDMVTSEGYRHVPIGTLALLAQRLGKVFASRSTWYRLVRYFHWRRPRQRIHPSKPKVGMRASRPNEIWHVDTTLIRLLDGSRAYLQAIIDNFSRRILAWKVSPTFDPLATATLLQQAAKGSTMGLDHQTPTLLTDGGVENCNGAVDQLLNSGLLKRLLAMTEITFSNSLIEAWWRTLKHQWLYLNTLDRVSTLEKLIAFYVQEHNTRLPHSAFAGQTPDEMYLGTGSKIPEILQVARKAARQVRLQANRTMTCSHCAALM
jgi:putative transposase